MTSSADLRENLRTAYLVAFDNFATDAKEIAAALSTDAKHANAILRALADKNLVTSDHINGETKLTWQCFETYDSISRSTAIRRFDKAFPKGERVEIAEPVSNGRKGATGARYTDEQIRLGLAARKAGKSNREVAEAAGVKSPNYFAKILKSAKPKTPRSARSRAAKSAAVDKKVRAAGVEVKPRPRRVVRRSSKAGA